MRPLAHEEIQDLLGAYALHAVEPDEVEVVERHLEECPRCRAEVAGHREVATLLGNTGGAAPEGLWDRIASQLEEAAPPMRLSLPVGQGNVIPIAARRRQRTNRLMVAALGAAAAVVIGLLGAQVVRQDGRIQDLESAMDGSTINNGVALATLASPDGSVTADAVLLEDGTGYLLASALPGLAKEQTYQLWGRTDDGLISLGLLGSDPRRVLPFQAGDQVSGLAITQEVAAGVRSSTHPPIMEGAFS